MSDGGDENKQAQDTPPPPPTAAAAPEPSFYDSWLSTDFGNASLSTMDLQGSESWGGGTASPAGSSVWASHSTVGGGGAFFDSSTTLSGPRSSLLGHGGGPLPPGVSASVQGGHRRTRSGGDGHDLLRASTSAARPGSVGAANRAASLAGGLPVGRSSSGSEHDRSRSVTSDIHDAARITNWMRVHSLSLSQPQSAKYTGPDRWTALHHACSRRCPHAYVVEALLRAYPGALLDLDEKAWTPLHHAARFKAPRDVVRLLLMAYPDKGRAAASKRCSRGRTPLYYAIRYDAPDGVVEMLLEADPTAVLEPDRDGVTPLGLVWDKYATSFEGKRAVQPYLSMLHASLGEAGAGAAAASSLELKGGGSAILTNKKLRSKWEKADMLLRAAFRFPLSEEEDEAKNGEDGNRLVEGEDEDGEVESPQKPREPPNADDDTETAVAASAAAVPSDDAERRRKWRILHAASAVKCHPTLFSLACILYPEQAHEFDENDLYGYEDDADANVESSGSSSDGAAASTQQQQQQPDDSGDGMAKKSSHRTALHFAAASPTHGREGRTVLTSLLALNPKAAAIADGVTASLPLHLAAENERKGHWMHDGLSALHDANGGAVRVQDERGRTPLHRACAVMAHRSGGSSSAAAAAPPAPAAAAPAPSAEPAAQAPAPLFPAPADGAGEGITTSTDATAANATTRAPTNTAAAIGSVVQNLVTLYPDAAAIPDASGRLPLHLIAEHGESWTPDADAVLDANPAASRARAGREACHGRLPIHMSAASPDAGPTLIARLVEAHPRGASLPDASGKLPLHLACESGKRWSAGVDTIHGAYPQAVSRREDNHRKWTALHMAAACPHAGPDLIDELVELNPQAACEVDGMGRYPLHLACSSGKPWDSGLSTIFRAYPDAAVVADANGWLPFHCAAMSYSVVPTKTAATAAAASASSGGGETPGIPRTSSASSDDSVVTTSTGGGEHEARGEEAPAAAVPPRRTEDSEDELTKINILYALIREAPHGL